MNLQDVKCFLLDMDGTFYLGGQLIEGSLSFIEKVQATGRDFLFLTNNSSHNANFYVEKLARMGLTVDRSKVLTSGEATADKLNELYPGKRAFVLGNGYLVEELKELNMIPKMFVYMSSLSVLGPTKEERKVQRTTAVAACRIPDSVGNVPRPLPCHPHRRYPLPKRENT